MRKVAEVWTTIKKSCTTLVEAQLAYFELLKNSPCLYTHGQIAKDVEGGLEFVMYYDSHISSTHPDKNRWIEVKPNA